MIVIMLGAPASGKGTQSAIVAQRLKVPHISTGDIFRWNIANNTAVGEEAKKYIDKGMLVPDELTIRILKERIEKRTDAMIRAGLLDEVKGVLARGYRENLKSLQSLGYKQIIGFLNGQYDWRHCVDFIKRDTWQYARRQMTWFSADKEINWFAPDALDILRRHVKIFQNENQETE